MAVKREIHASDGNTYEIEITSNTYTVKRDGEILVKKMAPAVANKGISEEDAAFRFACEDVDRIIEAERK